MLKKIAILSLATSIIFSCSIDNPFSADTKSTKSSINSSFGDLDITKKVEIKILNPTNKSTAEWYKKDDKTVIMKVGSQADLIGTASLKDETKSSNVNWSSSDNTIAVVNNGKITANKLGTTTILATSNLDSAYKGILNVQVVDAANFSSVDNPDKVKTVEAYVEADNTKGNALKLLLNSEITGQATVTLSDNSRNANVIWESSDENIATVNQEGKITAKKIGIVSILARYRLNPDNKALINVEVVKDLPSGKSVLLTSLSSVSINPVSFTNEGIMGTWCLTDTWDNGKSIFQGFITINKKINDNLLLGKITTELIKDDSELRYRYENADLKIDVTKSINNGKIYLKMTQSGGKLIKLKSNSCCFRSDDQFEFEVDNTQDFPNSIIGKGQLRGYTNVRKIQLDRKCDIVTPDIQNTISGIVSNSSPIKSNNIKYKFFDDFNDNSNKWFEEDAPDVARTKISDGSYIFEGRRDSSKPNSQSIISTALQIGLDQDKDFYIETQIKKVFGNDNDFYGVLFGSKNNDGDRRFLIYGNGNYSYIKSDIGKANITFLKKGTSQNINTGNSANKLSIKKINGNKLEFYINDKLTFDYTFDGLVGDEIGFTVNGKTKIEVEYIIANW